MFGYWHRENSRNAWMEAGSLQTEMNQPFVQGLHLLLEDQADLQVLKGLAHPDINRKLSPIKCRLDTILSLNQ